MFPTIEFTKTTAGQTITVGSGKDFATVQEAVDSINATVIGNVIIDIDAGTYNENVVIMGKNFSSDYTIKLNGKYSTLVSSTAMTSSTVGSDQLLATITVGSAGWTVNAYQNKMIHILSGNNIGEYRIIDSNTGDTLTLVGNYFLNVFGTDNFEILDWSVIIAPLTGIALSLYNQNGIVVNDMCLNDLVVEHAQFEINRTSLITHVHLGEEELYSISRTSLGKFDKLLLSTTDNFYGLSLVTSNIIIRSSKIYAPYYIGIYIVTGYLLVGNGSVIDGSSDGGINCEGGFVQIYQSADDNIQINFVHGIDVGYVGLVVSRGGGLRDVSTCSLSDGVGTWYTAVAATFGWAT